MLAPSFSPADFALALQQLLPRGRAWPRDADATMAQAIGAFASSFSRNSDSANGLLVDAFPATASGLLTEWESTLGLPYLYSSSAESESDRQDQVVAALTDVGGQSVSYFVGMAEKLGVSITITQFRPYRVSDPVNAPIYGVSYAYSWQVNLSSDGVFHDVTADVDAAIAYWDNVALATVLVSYKPAHTVVALNFY